MRSLHMTAATAVTRVDTQFTHVGIDVTKGKANLRMTNNLAARIKRLKNGTQTFIELSEPMTKPQAAAFLKTTSDYDDVPLMKEAVDRTLAKSEVKIKEPKAPKALKAPKAPKKVKSAAPSEEASSEIAPVEKKARKGRIGKKAEAPAEEIITIGDEVIDFAPAIADHGGRRVNDGRRALDVAAHAALASE
jgi:hypothetical protein